MHHKAKDTHLGSTTVVKLYSELLVNSGLVPLGLCKVNTLDLLLAGSVTDFEDTNEKDDLEDAEGRHGLKSSEAVLDTGEGGAVGDVAGKTNTCGGYDVSEDSHHSNTAVLGLDGSVKVELLLVSILQKAKRIPEAKRSLSTDGVLF